MKTLGRAHAGLLLTVLLSISLLMSTSLVAVSQDEIEPESSLPDVLVWVDARNPAGHFVSITFSKLIDQTEAETLLANLLADTGWVATSINISDASLEESGEFPMTSIDFSTPQAVNLSSGELPIEPYVKVLRNTARVQLIYMVPEGFPFQGVRDFENQYVKIVFASSLNTYRYDIVVKDADFETLGLPTAGQAAPAENTGRNRVVVWSVIVLALLAAVLGYVITSRYTRRNSTVNSNRRS